jgi:hypothetical protein
MSARAPQKLGQSYVLDNPGGWRDLGKCAYDDTVNDGLRQFSADFRDFQALAWQQDSLFCRALGLFCPLFRSASNRPMTERGLVGDIDKARTGCKLRPRIIMPRVAGEPLGKEMT